MFVSQPKMVGFSFCNKGLRAKNALCHMEIYLRRFYWKDSTIRENMVVTNAALFPTCYSI